MTKTKEELEQLLIKEIVAGSERSHRLWPSNLHSQDCPGCYDRKKKRDKLKELGLSQKKIDELIPFNYGWS